MAPRSCNLRVVVVTVGDHEAGQTTEPLLSLAYSSGSSLYPPPPPPLTHTHTDTNTNTHSSRAKGKGAGLTLGPLAVRLAPVRVVLALLR